MPKKFFFVVSRRFQVERYLKYIKQLNISKASYEFICISAWTGGDALMSLGNQPHSKLPRLKILKKPIFGNLMQYGICILQAWLNILFLKGLSSKENESIIFIDQYFSPLEFLAISTCPNLKAVILHQHSLNYINQLYINRRRKIFIKVSHQLLKKYFLFFAKKELNYYGAFYSFEAKETASHLQGMSRVFLISNFQNINFLPHSNFYNNKKNWTSTKTAALISPGMFRYNNKSLIRAQTNYFEQTILAATILDKKMCLTMRPKPGETIKNKLDFLPTEVSVSNSNTPFCEFLSEFDLFICPSISTTWCQVLAACKSLIVVRQKQLENEYPFFSDLFSIILSRNHQIEYLIKDEVYFIKAEDTINVYKDICYILNLKKEEPCIEIKELISCVK